LFLLQFGVSALHYSIEEGKLDIIRALVMEFKSNPHIIEKVQPEPGRGCLPCDWILPTLVVLISRP
jgi:hypothetical protein